MIKSKDSSISTSEISYNYFHWGPFLFTTQVKPEECAMILEEGKKCRRKSHDYRHQLAGHLSEEYSLTNATEIGEWLKKYFEAYVIGYNKWRGGGSMEPRFKLTSLWINYMKANEFNPPHDHACDLSFVLYAHIPAKLIKENEDFKGTLRGPGGVTWMYGEGGRQYISIVHRMPKTRDLYIFPTSLKHWVFPFRSNVERVSVSGNILLGQDSRTNFYGEKNPSK
tara:strand:+ start:372 stop:1043 length:672 start_codon:yes stop_codon:yes gene_type:complete